jgi:glycosyltransferase involved in cell wall biosynthesis
MGAGASDASVVVCTYDLGRWDQLVEAVGSILAQSAPVREVLVVVDHNPALLDWAQAAWSGTVVRVVANQGGQGLSGARNTGVHHATSEIVAFLDDDAVAEPAWMDHLLAPYADPSVLACGGEVVPLLGGPRPVWWPLEFDWVIGCSYVGLPTSRADVRNVIGDNMSARRLAILGAGGFPEGIGRIGTRPVGCEETDLSIRLGRSIPGARIVYEPAARVHHRVPPARLTWAYFRSRCLAEGLSKALVAARLGTGDALASERAHALRVLPAGMARGLRRGAPRRSLAIASGLALTTAGYLHGRLTTSAGPPSPLPALVPA